MKILWRNWLRFLNIKFFFKSNSQKIKIALILLIKIIISALQSTGLDLIYFFLFLIISAGLMVFGINKRVRGWLLPWLFLWGIICFFQLLFGIWLLWAYYIYVSFFFFRKLKTNHWKQKKKICSRWKIETNIKYSLF